MLRELVSDPRSRDSGNTMLAKEFPGGILVMTGANSAVGLRSMAARYLFLDEIDALSGRCRWRGRPSQPGAGENPHVRATEDFHDLDPEDHRP